MRRKCIMLGMRYDGLKILLLLRRTPPELRENHILPMMEEPYGYADYHETQRAFLFQRQPHQDGLLLMRRAMYTNTRGRNTT